MACKGVGDRLVLWSISMHAMFSEVSSWVWKHDWRILRVEESTTRIAHAKGDSDDPSKTPVGLLSINEDEFCFLGLRGSRKISRKRVSLRSSFNDFILFLCIHFFFFKQKNKRCNHFYIAWIKLSQCETIMIINDLYAHKITKLDLYFLFAHCISFEKQNSNNFNYCLICCFYSESHKMKTGNVQLLSQFFMLIDSCLVTKRLHVSYKTQALCVWIRI